MRSVGTWSLGIIATATIMVGLYLFREALTQFALAVFLWLVIDALAVMISRPFGKWLPRWLAVLVALIVVASLSVLVVGVIADNAGGFVRRLDGFEARLDQVLGNIWAATRLEGTPPTVGQLFTQANPAKLLGQIAGAAQSLVSNAIFVVIYVGFLFAAQGSFSTKLDALNLAPAARARLHDVLDAIRACMMKYLWSQTVVSLLISVLTYLSFRAIGLEQALFWAFVTFLLNYVPTIGSILAVALPSVFALAQFGTLWPVGVVAGAATLWQFGVGNFLQPRLTGDALNMSGVVVLVSLAIWGTIWGIPGMFLAAPLTTMVMIVLAQFAPTRWLAILMSENGNPDGRAGPSAPALAPQATDSAPANPPLA